MASVAFVMGTDCYQDSASFPRLKCPVADAEAMGSHLQSFGFHVERAMEPSKAEFDEQYEAFLAAAQGARTAIVFAAGHAVEFFGEQEIALRDTESGVRGTYASLSQMRRRLQAVVDSHAAILFVVDGCRTDGCGRRAIPGGEVEHAPPPEVRLPVWNNRKIAMLFACEPGGKAYDDKDGHGALTKHLLIHLRPGRPLGEVFEATREGVRRDTRRFQDPWLHACSLTQVPIPGRQEARRGWHRKGVPAITEAAGCFAWNMSVFAWMRAAAAGRICPAASLGNTLMH